jgi:formiminotetrahydrofolate cyclodeaminase
MTKIRAERVPGFSEGRDPAKAPSGGLSAGVVKFIEQLAAPTPMPAGGCASAAAGAMAAGLACMVATISRGRKANLQHEGQLSEAIGRLTTLRQELCSAVDSDAESYEAVMKAFKMVKDSSGGRREINAALRWAASVPLGVAEMAAEVAGIAIVLKPITGPRMNPDLATAIALARAAFEASLTNVRVNLDLIEPDSPEERSFVRETWKRVEALKVGL